MIIYFWTLHHTTVIKLMLFFTNELHKQARRPLYLSLATQCRPSVLTTRARYALHYYTWFGSVCTGLYFFLLPFWACGELIDCTLTRFAFCVQDTLVVLAAVPAYRVVCDIFSYVLLPSAFRQGRLNLVSRSWWLQTGRGQGKVLNLRELLVVRASHSVSYTNETLLTA